MNLDTAIFAQIQPYLLYSKKLELSDEDGKSLVADMYLAAFEFYNKELPKYRKRLDHIESLKAGKEYEIIENLQEQQKNIVDESEEHKNKYLSEVYNKWVDEYLDKKEKLDVGI